MNDTIKFDHSALLASEIGERWGLKSHDLFQQLKRGESFPQDLLKDARSERAGFPLLPDDRDEAAALSAFADLRRGTFETLLLLGVGGSSLGLIAIDQALRPVQRSSGRPSLRCIDNTDPATIARAMDGLEPSNTLSLVVSKSGNTVDTLASLAIVSDWYREANISVSSHMVAVTRPEGGYLNNFALRHEIPVFNLPDDVGGRFSVLSPVGMLPAALLGYEIRAFLEGAAEVRDSSFDATSLEANKPLVFAATHTALMKSGYDTSVFMPYDSRLEAFGAWFVQLWCESLGKGDNLNQSRVATGQNAIAAVGARAQHSLLQLMLEGPNTRITTLVKVRKFGSAWPLPEDFDYEGSGLEYLKGKELVDLLHAQLDGTRRALIARERPSLLLEVGELNERTIGALFMFFQLATAYAGRYLNIDPYNQPAVELGKRFAREILSGQESGPDRES